MRVFILTVLLTAIAPLMRADQSRFQFVREISAPEAEGFGSVTFDKPLYENIASDYRDLRVLREREGEAIEWPYLVERVSRGAVNAPSSLLASEMVSFDENPDGSIETVVHLKKDAGGAVRLRIETPLRDFEKSIDVYGSLNEANWEPLLEGELIFDRERFVNFRRTELKLPVNEFTSYKVVIANATDEQRSSVREVTEVISDRGGESRQERQQVETRSFLINALSFFSAPVNLPAGRDENDYPVVLISNRVNEDEKRTEVVVEAGRVPLRSLTVATGDANFRRDVRVEVPAGEDQWRTIKRGVIHRYRVGDVDEENLTVRFDEARSDRYRLIIENRDSPPLQVVGISGTGEVYEVRFLAQPGDRFSLFYGSDSTEVEAPQYDVAAIQQAIKGEVAMLPLDLKEPAANLEYDPDNKAKLPLLQQPWVLWVLIGVVVAVLIRVIYTAAKQVEEVGE